MRQLDFLRRLWSSAPATPPPVTVPTPREISAQPLQDRARGLLRGLGHAPLAERLTVRWSKRLRSTAGLAYLAKTLIALNPRLVDFGDAEVDRTLLHELAHLLAHDRAGRRRIAPHGPEWRRACRDLGLLDETRCHTLPLPRRRIPRRHAYRCPACGKLLERVRPLGRKAACLACCRTHSAGEFDERFAFVKLRTR